MGGLEASAARAGGSIAAFLGKRLWRRLRIEQLRELTAPTIPAAVARATIDELSRDEARGLASYLDSPDLEQLAVQVVLLGKRSDNVATAIREELRHGLRHATGIPADRLVAVTDLVFDALLVASNKDEVRLDPLDVAAKAHLAAAAARNGELLSRVTSLKAFHDKAAQLRAQVRALHAKLRVPHTGASRTVPWHQLYVEPSIERGPGVRTVILGDPGAGKSTFAAKLAHDTAGTDIVPFLVVLRDLPQSALERRFAEHLVTVAAAPYNVEMSVEAVEYLLLNGRATVICDGLDELADVSMRRRVVDLIEGFTHLFPATQVVVTSRKVGYERVPLDALLFRTTTIDPFDEKRIAAYAANWFALDGHGPRLPESFVTESRSIADLRSNPLLLSLLCGMYSSEQYIPRNRVEVYEKCAVMLFDSWDRMRGITMPVVFQGFVRGAIQELAWQLFAKSPEPRMRQRQVMSVLIGYLRVKGFDEHDARREAADFLDFCAGRAWVLAEVGATETEPIYGFAHRTFMEFFAAEHLVRHSATAQEVFAALRPSIEVGAWEEVGQLALQLFDRARDGGAEDLLELFLEGDDRNLVGFAARAAGSITFSPALCGRVVASAVACEQRLSLESRLSLGVLAHDMPLRTLAHEGLGSNRHYLDRAISEHLEWLAAVGDEMAKFLLLDEPQRLVPDAGTLCRLVAEGHHVWLPSVYGVPDGRLRQVSEWLMRQPTPWVPEGAISSAYFPGSANAVVLLLPHLEWMAKSVGPSIGYLDPLISARHRGEDLWGVELPEYCLGFVGRWARGEFSVLG